MAHRLFFFSLKNVTEVVQDVESAMKHCSGRATEPMVQHLLATGLWSLLLLVLGFPVDLDSQL